MSEVQKMTFQEIRRRIEAKYDEARYDASLRHRTSGLVVALNALDDIEEELKAGLKELESK